MMFALFLALSAVVAIWNFVALLNSTTLAGKIYDACYLAFGVVFFGLTIWWRKRPLAK